MKIKMVRCVSLAIVLGVLAGASSPALADSGSTSYDPRFVMSSGTQVNCHVEAGHRQTFPSLIDDVITYWGTNSCTTSIRHSADVQYWGDSVAIYFPQFGQGPICGPAVASSCSSTRDYNNPATNHPGAMRATLYHMVLFTSPGATWVTSGLATDAHCTGYGETVLDCHFPHHWTIPL